ncbi:MAG TPA: DUF6178 family protein [Smithellaceae bacterium]|nr:DUF6178 family protein [Smithellaceae bacterium]HRS89460.1 DUF6178 family protein [Smithellaceae bacterium]HRV26409.1 DUF6178 family protein [Smithellaceae bacterium]
MTNLQQHQPLEKYQVLRELLSLSGSELLKSVLEKENPAAFIQGLSSDDFYWMVKRVGEDDAVELLRLASADQWQYLLDLEVWAKDLPETQKALIWFGRLLRADPTRLAKWVYKEQTELASLVLLRQTEIIFRQQDDDDWEVPPGYFTLDGAFYIKAKDGTDAHALENILRALAHADYPLYRSLLLSLAARIPAETEEELYRQRGNRLAEYGFLPPDEAMVIFAPLDKTALQRETKILLPGAVVSAGEKSLMPMAPFASLENFPLLTEALTRISDPLQIDRLRVEFAALCNTLIAAASFSTIGDYDDLRRIGRQAAGYLHVAVQDVCGQDPDGAAALLYRYSLQTIFRVGFGLAVKLQWRCKRWHSQSWVRRIGKGVDFWGSPWSEALEGLLFTHPLYYDVQAAAPRYRHFECLDDLRKTQTLLEQVEALDEMLTRLAPLEKKQDISSEKIYPFLFNRWARHVLQLEPSFAPLSRAEAQKFFGTLRRGESEPPYKMEGYRDVFLDEFLKGAADFTPEAQAALRAALEQIWVMFCREYENVPPAGLDARWSPYLALEQTPDNKMKRKTAVR